MARWWQGVRKLRQAIWACEEYAKSLRTRLLERMKSDDITAMLYETEQAPTIRNCIATIRFATKTKTKLNGEMDKNAFKPNI